MLVRPTGFEPVAPRLGILCSILLSYGRALRLLDKRKAQGNLGTHADQLVSPGGATGNGRGMTWMPSSCSALASSIVAWPWMVSTSLSP